MKATEFVRACVLAIVLAPGLAGIADAKASLRPVACPVA